MVPFVDAHKDRCQAKWNGRRKCENKHRFVVAGTNPQAAGQGCKVTCAPAGWQVSKKSVLKSVSVSQRMSHLGITACARSVSRARTCVAVIGTDVKRFF